jgi:hypothetical protein
MAKYVKTTVNGAIVPFLADNVLSVLPLTTTTTAIKYCGGSGPVTATFTHAAEASATAGTIAAAVFAGIERVQSPKQNPDVSVTVTVPLAISAVAWT